MSKPPAPAAFLSPTALGRTPSPSLRLVFALLLGIDRRIPENVAALRAHQWNKKEFSKADGLYGKTLGIVGLGQIGREVIARAYAFGLRTIAWSRSLTPRKAEDLGVELCADLDDLFRRADIVTLHVALKPETRRLVNAARLAADQLEQLIQQPNQPAKNIVRWLNLLADLQIRGGLDYESIRATLQRIIDRAPNLAAAQNARQRIELLKLELKGKQKNESVKMGTYEQNLGLKKGTRPRLG
jgi:hypothetical protein